MDNNQPYKMECVNCKYEHNNHFCPNCGEKANVPKITLSSIFSSGISTIVNMDKGFLLNVKHLFLNPQKLINDYINGRRKNIFNPISFLIIIISVYLILDSIIVNRMKIEEVNDIAFPIAYETGKFVKIYFKYFWLLSILWLSLSTQLVFRRYNYAEHLAINSFVVSQATFIGLIIFLTTQVELIFNPLVYISMVWLIYKVFKSKKKDWDVLLQSFLSVFLFFIQLVIIVVLIAIIKSQLN